MTSLKNLEAKFYRKPIPNDITYAELKRIVENHHCRWVSNKGNHPFVVRYDPLSKKIPIPKHGKYVKEAYIAQVKELLMLVEEMEGD